MGMTIDDNVDFLNEAKDIFEDIANNPKIYETLKTYFIIESLETAIETMRKYQRIEEVINRLKNINDHTTSIDLLFEIKEIIENGNTIK